MALADYTKEDQERIRKVLQMEEEDPDVNSWEFDFLDDMISRIAWMEEMEGTEDMCDNTTFTEKQREKIDELAHKYLRGSEE